MKFFFDNCISPVYARAIDVLIQSTGDTITHLRDKFSHDTPDTEWISALAVDGDWILVSGDPRITRGKPEREAWRESRLTAFFFGDGWASRGYWSQVEELVRWWPKIVEQAKKAEKGAGFILPFKGKEMKVLYPP